MNTTDMIPLDTRLQDLYGDRWSGLTAGMAKLWLDELRRFDPAILTIAVNQWARKNTFRAPGIDDLVELAIDIEDTQQFERSRQFASTRQPSQGPGYGDILERAALNAPYDSRRWARLHVELFMKISQHAPPEHSNIRWNALTLEQQCALQAQRQVEAKTRDHQRQQEAAALCESFAQHYPKDALAWRSEATWWRGGCGGVGTSLEVVESGSGGRQPGEEG